MDDKSQSLPLCRYTQRHIHKNTHIRELRREITRFWKDVIGLSTRTSRPRWLQRGAKRGKPLIKSSGPTVKALQSEQSFSIWAPECTYHMKTCSYFQEAFIIRCYFQSVPTLSLHPDILKTRKLLFMAVFAMFWWRERFRIERGNKVQSNTIGMDGTKYGCGFQMWCRRIPLKLMHYVF